ncbi:transcriptional regulator [Paenibacillus sp. FSL H8-0548]|uniref:LacI family DNA-binding transcriptional regulator n=1 Tax=Paenibacillus sp. FSL H8-0548 TaxID=1920422 RepID=UPI00096F0B50|nr:LacI family DNA-binding transcriptional regulator [Paenibacillus sp. FSL H8-0548]OMF34707.1 transcriptional regulator [Paenibacillus sp. FSL H8-0548]
MRGKVTIQQIADLAGLSKFAVSRALAGKTGVSDSTREMILKTAGQLGYFKSSRPSPLTQSPDHSTDKITGTIVVLFPNIRYQNKDSVYWGPIFDGISARLNQREMDILTLTEPSSDHVFSLLNPNAIQGIITLGTVSTQILLDIKKLEIPVVMIDHLDPALHADTIFTDNFTCMRELMLQLVSKGYKDFQFVGRTDYAQSFFERWIAYRSVLDEYGLTCEQDPLLTETEAELLHEVIPLAVAGSLPEVFVCANDHLASTVMHALHERGIEVPKQVAVTGFDNTDKDYSPLLTTVNVNKELLGMRAVDKMIWRIQNPQSMVEKTLIYAEVLMRESTN